MLFEGVAGRFLVKQASTLAARFTPLGSVPVAQVESEFLEITRAGRRFSSILGTTGIAPVQTVPTTAAAWSLYNADPNRAYVIDSITFFVLSGTPVSGGTILSIVSPITATLPTLAAGGSVSSCSAGGLITKAIPNTGYTLPAPTGQTQWTVSPGHQGQGAAGVAAASIGANLTADVRGRLIVPPGKILGLTLLAGAGTTPLYIPSVIWSEVELDLE